MVHTPSSWRAYKADPQVTQVISSYQNGNASLQIEGARPVVGGRFMGNFAGYDHWLYSDWFIDPADGQEKPMLADGTVLLGSPEVQGTRAFAAIMDPELNYPAIPFAPKSWTTQDPGARWLMTQSSPLVIPTRVNASAAATVI